MIRRHLTCWLLVLGCWSSEPVRGSDLLDADQFEAGFLAHSFPLTSESGSRKEFAGPLFYQQESETSLLWSVPPFFTWYSDPKLEQVEYESFYPFLTYRRFGTESRWQFLQVVSFGGASTVDAEVKSRGDLWPLFFYQRSTNPTNSYFWLLPFYGHVQGHLFRDEIRTTAFPFYLWSRKGEMETDNYLFPFFHLRHGGNVTGWQFFPVVGRETKLSTTRTNVADEVEVVPGYNRSFFLWPFFNSDDNNLGTTNVEHLRISFPFYSIQRSQTRDNTTLLWPFFSYTEDREKGFHEWGLPYPFIGWARGPGKHANRFWPFWGKATNDIQQSDFVLWPVYTHNHLHTPGLDRERTRSLFFAYSDSHLADPQTGSSTRRVALWPFFTWHRDITGKIHFRALSIAEPLFPNNKSIDRSWAPLWSLYRREVNPKTAASSDSLLWNLWRRDVRGKERRSSLLFGLIRTRQDAVGERWRILGLPFSPHPTKPIAAAASPSGTNSAFLPPAPSGGLDAPNFHPSHPQYSSRNRP